MTDTEVLLWAFKHVYHADLMNAAMHCAEVRYSPITFRLAEALHRHWGELTPSQMSFVLPVLADKGAYEEDPGR